MVLFALRLSPNKPETTPVTPRVNGERTCSQDLLLEVKQGIDNITDILMNSQYQQPVPTCRGQVDQKSQLVSALTGKSVDQCLIQFIIVLFLFIIFFTII